MIFDDIIIDADGPFRRVVVITLIVVAVHVEHGHRHHCGQIFQIMAVQISAGQNHLYILEFFRAVVFPQTLALFIRHGQQFHSSASFSTGRRSLWMPCMRYIAREASANSSYSGT